MNARRYLPLICLSLMHTLVDTTAQFVDPLWDRLQVQFALASVAALSVAFLLQSMPTSVSQAVFGYFRDRKPHPRFIWLGPLAAVLCMTSIGLANERVTIAILVVIGGIGIGAFHPEAAVAAGRALPEHRTRSLSLFMFGGALGLGLGPTLSGAVVAQWGMRGLLVLTVPMTLLVALLWRLGRLGELVEARPADERRRSLGEMMQGRGWLAVSILLVCSLRLVPNMAMTKVLAFTLAERGYGTFQTGLTQTLFLISASAGMMIMAFRFRSGRERPFMSWCPLLGIPIVFVMGLDGCPEWLLFSLLVPAGLILWGTTPAMVSYAQQQFPQGAGVASALTMGMSWGLGGLMQAPITAWFASTGRPQAAFHAFIAFVAAAALGAWLLPAPREEAERAIAIEGSRDLPVPHPEPVDA